MDRRKRRRTVPRATFATQRIRQVENAEPAFSGGILLFVAAQRFGIGGRSPSDISGRKKNGKSRKLISGPTTSRWSWGLIFYSFEVLMSTSKL